MKACHPTRAAAGTHAGVAQAQRTLATLVTLFGLLPASLAGCASTDKVSPAAVNWTGTSDGPFFEAREHQPRYAGPGREAPAPEDVEEVRIGYFGPTDPGHAEAGGMWAAASLAIEEANQAGGCRGLLFRLVASWSENPWGTGVRDVARLVYDENVWAIVGAPDGPSAHLVAQVVAKARLTFVSAVSTDKTANLANVPWIFSCAPGDHLLAPVLAQALISQAGGGNLAVVSCTDHDSRLFTAELLTSLGERSAFPVLRLDFHPGDEDFDLQLDRLAETDPTAIAVIAGPADSANFVSALRQKGLVQPVFGGPAMGHGLFVQAAGEAAEGVVFPLLWHAQAPGEHSRDVYARRFEERFGIEPDYMAAHTYDAVNLLIAAIRQAGLNRVRIRDAVAELSPWPGVTGPITWDPTGHNHRPVSLGTISDGCIVPYGTNRVLNRR